MSLGASQLAQILQRQGVLSTDQADQVVKEARTAPGREGNARAFEQRARAYDLVQRLQFPSTNSPTGVLGEAEIAKVPMMLVVGGREGYRSPVLIPTTSRASTRSDGSWSERSIWSLLLSLTS